MQMAPPSSGAYILITDGALRMTRDVTATLVDSEEHIQKGEHEDKIKCFVPPPTPQHSLFP